MKQNQVKPPQLTIAIDRNLRERYGPEITWTLRMLLSNIGYAWHEVNCQSKNIDIYYGCSLKDIKSCKIFIKSDENLWNNRNSLKISDVIDYQDFVSVKYKNQKPPENLIYKNDKTICIQKDLVFDMFWLMAGLYEKDNTQIKHGFYDFSNTIYENKEIFSKALSSGVGAFIKKILRSAFPGEPLNSWPERKSAAINFSHDIDYPEIIPWLEPLRIVNRLGLRGVTAAASALFGKRHNWHFDSWCKIEGDNDIKSAFYFVARQGSLWQYANGLPDPFYNIQDQKFKNLFRYLKDVGAEIGLHASYLAHTSKDKFATEIKLLEKAAEITVHGNRHHYWQLDAYEPEKTLQIHNEIGLSYDTSLSHDKYMGWRRHTCWPFFPFHKQKRHQINTLQLPPGWMDQQLFGNKNLTQEQILMKLRILVDTVVKHQGILMVNIHNYFYDPVLYPKYSDTYRMFCEYIASRSDCWLATPAATAQYWKDRYVAITDNSEGLEL